MARLAALIKPSRKLFYRHQSIPTAETRLLFVALFLSIAGAREKTDFSRVCNKRRFFLRNTGLLGSDQPLHASDLIGKATLNVLEPGGRREITSVEEKRSHVCNEHISFKQEVVRLCQLRFGK
jgi:hypothetical protein